jgi:ADP-ribose pyrophosphatase YjhB (NUDIX family)
MKPIEHFQFCPRCGRNQPDAWHEQTFRCPACGFLLYFNPAIAAAAFVLDQQERILFIWRAKDPAKGKLAIPGGFIDTGETAEAALRREVREEVNVELDSIEYLCSRPNEYHYHDVTYPVLDCFFTARARAGTKAEALDGVERYSWLRASEVDPAQIAFPSVREALEVFRATGAAEKSGKGENRSALQ